MDGNYARQNNLSGTAGVVVSAVANGSPAAQAGITPGFVILRVGNTPVNSVDEFTEAMRQAIGNLENSRRKTISLLVTDRNKRNFYYTLRFE